MDGNTLSFLRKVYREHYFKRHNLIEIPTAIASREFGYIPFAGGMIRHLSFADPGELFAELVRQAPSSVFCSNAIYERPRLQMDEKGWKGADLIFDIDADSIPTACKPGHTWWFCSGCHTGGKGPKPPKCPNCKSEAVEQVHWSCPECLDETKNHVKRLLGFLQGDFGVDPENIKLYFSGNRGYHAQVHDERYDMADAQMRGEIANYIKGTGLSVKAQESAPGRPELGWSRRTSSFLLQTEGTSRSKRTQKLATQVVAANAALIDESVTTDVHRVFRMPGTLHGKSGLLKKRVLALEEFDPQLDPVVLSGDPIRAHVYYSPEFTLNGTKFGPYESSTVQIPIYAAVFLLARGLGELVN